MCNVCNVVLIFNMAMAEPTGSFDGSEPGSPLPETAVASAFPAGALTICATSSDCATSH